jgi:hypothetical protein
MGSQSGALRLESAQTGEQRTFADLAALWAFLAEQTAGDGIAGERSPPDTPT